MTHEGATLVIVDMQPDLPASTPDWLRSAVRLEIMNARSEGSAIIFLEYMHTNPPRTFGDTYQDLVSAAAADNAPLFAMRAKMTEDGSDRVADACSAKQFPTQRFRVCGVNTHACIQTTVDGLARRFPDSIIEVVGHACNDYRGNNWANFVLHSNVQVV